MFLEVVQHQSRPILSRTTPEHKDHLFQNWSVLLWRQNDPQWNIFFDNSSTMGKLMEKCLLKRQLKNDFHSFTKLICLIKKSF